MADQYTEVVSRNWWQNFINSFGGVALGIILFLLSFVVLWINEGRVDLSKVVLKQSIPITAATPVAEVEGKFVSLTGLMETESTVGDPGYLKAGPYIRLDRIVEMYGWEEQKKSETKDKLGGGSETITTYNYVKKWLTSPKSSVEFRYPEGHYNPPMRIKSATFYAPQAKIGSFRFDPSQIELPSASPLALSSENVLEGQARLEEGYLFLGSGALASPQVGDLRISYRAVPSGIKVTAFGKVETGELVPYYYKGKERIFRVLAGTRDEAVATLAGEYKTMLWVMRILGFVMMWFGLFLFFGPLTEVLDVLPFLGKASRFMVAVVTFPVALILSILTILISMIFHNIWLLVIAVALVFGGLFYFKKIKKGA